MFEAARVHDDIVHTHALMGFLIGAVIGIALVAAVALIPGGFLLCLAMGALAGIAAHAIIDVGEKLGEMCTSSAGELVTGSPNVFINQRPAAHVENSTAVCANHGSAPSKVAEGSENVFINSQAAARKDDKLTCGAKIDSGSSNVFIGGGRHRYLPVDDEIPKWARTAVEGALFVAGFAGGLVNVVRQGIQNGLKAATPCLIGFGAGMAGSWALDKYAISPAIDKGISAVKGLIGHPVDSVTGRKVLLDETETDFVLPGYLPITWSRFYASDLTKPGILGTGWRLPWEMSLQQRGDFIYFNDRQERQVPFITLAPGERVFSPSEQLWLIRSEGGHYLIRTLDDTFYYFGALEGEHLAPLTCIEDAFGHYQYIRHDESTGRITDITTDGGLWLHLNYITPNNATSQRLHTVEWVIDGAPVETLVRYHYDDRGLLATVTDRNHVLSRRFAYDDHGRMIRHENALGLECHYRWALVTSHARVVEHWTSDGEHFHFTYDTIARTSEVTDVLGRQAVVQYNASGFLTDVQDIDGQRYCFQRDSMDNVTGITLSDGRQLGFEYDEYARLVTFIDPEQRRTTYAYHLLSDRMSNMQAPDGQHWHAEYDDVGALISEQDTLGRTTTYANTPHGVPYAITDPAGLTRYLQLDQQAQPTDTTDCSGQHTRYEYDERLHLCAITNALGERTQLIRDAQGDITEVRYPDGRREQYRYNALGQVQEHIDPARAITRWRFTPRGLPLEQQDAQQRTRRMGFDEALRPVELINENNTRWSFTWDHADRLREETLFDGLTRRYEYDERGQLSHLIELGTALPDQERPHRKTHFAYDERGRLTERDSADYLDRIQYDDGDRMTLIERTPTPTGDSKGLEPSSLRFEYDEAGRLIGEGQGDQALAYAYDELDNLTHLTLPDGRQLNSLYYGSGHLLQLNLDQLEISHFERDALHREVMRTQGRLTSRTGYDRMGRKAWQFASPLDSRKLSAHQNPHVVASELVERGDNTVYRRYHYNSAGELESVEDKARPEQRFDYDRTGRLMRHWPAPMREEWFGYDRAANRILPGNDSNPRYMAVSDNRLREIEGTYYAYDGWGNLTRRTHGAQRQQFDYDSDNRLIRAQVYQHHQLTSDTRYHYDPLGRRIRKIVTQHNPKAVQATTHQTDFIWQGLRLLTETRRIPERPAETRVYCYEQNSYAPLARIDTAGGDLNTPSVYYFHTDALGTPKEVTDVDGEIVWQADYKAWGEIDKYRVQQIEQPLRFQGQYADDETGLYYTTFRYYDPHAGRFTTQDPIGLAGGWNLYQYAPNPLSWIDPLGLSGDNVFIHYTDKTGFENIMKTGVLEANAKGKVYITDILMSPKDVMRDILINDPKHVGRGDYAIIFKTDPIQMSNIKSSSALEYIHSGRMKLNDILYSGTNPYSIISRMDYETRRKLTANQMNARGKCSG